MFELGTLWPADILRRPPSFEKIEGEIWARFLDGYGDSYEGFYYNVKIGEGRISPTETDEAMRKMMADISVKRMDAVGKRGSTWDLIEVRRHAGPGSMGQMLAYETLWVAYSGGLRPYTLTIVTDYMDVDTQLAARDRGISIFIV